MSVFGGTFLYDPDVLEEHAQRLYRRSKAMRLGSTIAGGLFGAAAGSVPLTPIGDAWPVPAAYGIALALVGLVVGAVLGNLVSEARAFRIRFEAQASLCQLQLERNTAALLSRMLLESRPAERPVETIRETA
jgi:hypothetical protein